MTVIWIMATLAAAAAQTARNAMQRALTDAIGVVGATQVRFLFGLPFAVVFLAAACLLAGRAPPVVPTDALLWSLGGAVSQIVATGLMLAAMRDASFAASTAFVKTEPVLVAIVAALLLGDTLTPAKLGAIALATGGVILMGLKPGQNPLRSGARPLLLGVAAGGLFGLAAVCFRGAIISLPDGAFYLRASTILVVGLGLQTLILLIWLLATDRAALTASLRVWRPSLGAGFLGALASQFWFTAFSLTAAANVRTLALVEVFMAQAAARKLFRETPTAREMAGAAMIVAGVAGVLWLAR
jgi:drug/metabolite transporter (DMT)-like permease